MKIKETISFLLDDFRRICSTFDGVKNNGREPSQEFLNFIEENKSNILFKMFPKAILSLISRPKCFNDIERILIIYQFVVLMKMEKLL